MVDMRIRKEELEQCTKEQLIDLILLEEKMIDAYQKNSVKTPNVVSIMDFRIESTAPLEVIRKHLDEMISKHEDFSVWRRKSMIMQNELSKPSYCG